MTQSMEQAGDKPRQTAVWKQVVLHWAVFIGAMTALIGGAAVLFG
ncbi:MAG: hypothetical protein P3W94_001505 [Paracoccus sp. (in: a-proteobacteria)]|nr:hypothetical protein [Paracoccus sp. (in: a-proteobacteria)]